MGGPAGIGERGRWQSFVDGIDHDVAQRAPGEPGRAGTEDDAPPRDLAPDDGRRIPGPTAVDAAEEIAPDFAVDLGHQRRLGLGVGVVAGEDVGEALGVSPLPLHRIADVPGHEADVADAGPVGRLRRDGYESHSPGRHRSLAGSSPVGGQEDVLHVGVGIEGFEAEFATEARLLHPTEGRVDPDRGVRVDREHAGVHGPGHA